MTKQFICLLILFLHGVFKVLAQDVEQEFSVQPRVLKAGEYGVGRMVPNLTVTDLQGRELEFGGSKNNKALVIIIFSDYCPISNKFGPELARLERDYAGKPVAFIFDCPIACETSQDLMSYVSKYQLKSSVVHDADGRLAKMLGATTSTEAFVLDAARTLIYRGAINDQYGLGYSKDKPTRTYLRDAIDAVLCGKTPAIAATTAPGCTLDLVDAQLSTEKTPLNYYNQISRIMQANCVECHHAGGVTPFSLETFADLIENAGMIKQQVARGLMPPWFAAKQPGQTESPWINDRSLSEQDKTNLLAWLNSNRPQGNPADAPVARQFPGKWEIGKPDVVLQLPEPIKVKAEGFMPYQYRTIQTSFPEDRWIQAYEIMPTARSVLHHAIVSLQADGEDTNLLSESGATGFWAVYVPGYTYRVYPQGYARKLPAGAKLNFQIHYTPNGRATQDQLKIGLIFSKQPPQYEIHTLGIPQLGLEIPPGVHRHVETAEYRVPEDMNVTGYQAHTHLRGKAFRYELIKTNGRTETLLDIPKYDFNWQIQYDYIQPKFIPAGSTIRVLAVYDNSVDNPANPDPTKTVKWGQQTYDEMLIGYVEYYRPRIPTAILPAKTDSTNMTDNTPAITKKL
jgi:hypothetical protein